MANKFQNRLVGTIILIIISVIMLPAILDGKKKHYKEEFESIPLVSKPDDQQDIEIVSPVTQFLASQPLVERKRMFNVGSGQSNAAEQSTLSSPDWPSEYSKVAPLTNSDQQIEIEKARTVKQSKSVEPLRETQRLTPIEKVWVIQIGALQNAKKVNEIIAQLRLSGYRAYTMPSVPIQGEITRICVGPGASKAKMRVVLGELQSVIGLRGIVKPLSAC